MSFTAANCCFKEQRYKFLKAIHNCRKIDICDDLQGRYPKGFKFTGWHPHCRCVAISILKTERELMEENRAILRGEEPSKESANTVADVPDNFKKWVTDNRDRIARAKTLPYFLQDNGKYWNGGGQQGMAAGSGLLPSDVASDIGAKIDASMKPMERVAFASFEPFSPVITQKVAEARDRKAKNAILESVMSDTRAELLNEENGHRTTMFPGHKGPKSLTWKHTRKMAFELNEDGIDVTFLPELKDGISTDSLIRVGKTYWLADFKYCVTTKSNTLAKELEHGFEQAGTIVLKLTQMDAGTFYDSVDYLLRNNIPYGSIVLMNKYGKALTLTYKDIKSGKYIKKTKGFL